MDALEIEICAHRFRVTSEIPAVLGALRAAWQPCLSPTSGSPRFVSVERSGLIRLDGVPWHGAGEVIDVTERVEQLFFDVVLGAARDQPVLHAGGVFAEGLLLTFVGASGSGKSSMTREFLRMGAEYLSDDAIILSSSGPRGIARAVQFDLLPIGAPIPSYLTDCDTDSYVACAATPKAARVPLWLGGFRTLDRLGWTEVATALVVELRRATDDSVERLTDFERVRLLHEAALAPYGSYRGELGFGPSIRLSWSTPGSAAATLCDWLATELPRMGVDVPRAFIRR